MKLVYENMEHIVTFEEGYVNELIVENKKIFSEMVNSMFFQMDGSEGGFVLSIQNKPVEFSKYADVIIQFSPLLFLFFFHSSYMKNYFLFLIKSFY